MKMTKLIILLALALCIFDGYLMQPDNNINWRIIGGSDAKIGQYPHQVSLRENNYHFCGGSIISPNWILTAGHCIHGQLPSSFVVVVGTIYLNSGGVAHKVDQIICHEDYESAGADIGVIKLASTISYNEVVQPIDLASSIVPSGVSCVLSGWGRTKYSTDDGVPNNLQQIQLDSVSVDLCRELLPPDFLVYDFNICTVAPNGQGACFGDSGSALLCNGVQAGIVSCGVPCALGYPDVYTDVSYYLQWIRSKTGL